MANNRLTHFRQVLCEWNLFKNALSDAQSVHHERLSTRIYILLLMCFLLGAGIFTAFTLRTAEKIQYSPSQSTFEQLWKNYRNTLKCPCSRFAIAYEEFVVAHVQFHQVCSSEFVTQLWIDSVYIESNISSSSANDIRSTLSAFWQVIGGFCRLSNQTWIDAWTKFKGSTIFSPTAVDKQIIQVHARAALNSSVTITRATLNRTLFTMERIFTGNAFISGLGTNFHVHVGALNESFKPNPTISPKIFDNCSCMNISGCPRPAVFSTNQDQWTTVPGIIADCLVVDATLASTLECYYDRTCLFLLHEQWAMNVTPLSSNSNIHFSPYSTVQMLLDELMIDNLTIDIDFNLFYLQCNPAYCTYAYMHRFDILYIVTTIIGIFGGLSLALRLIAPLIAKAILRFTNRHSPTDNLTPALGTNRRYCKLMNIALERCTIPPIIEKL
jgi:hypothetical protein